MLIWFTCSSNITPFVSDKAGKVRVWDTINKEHILKIEHQPFSGEIKDIAWSGDSQRLAAGGQGKQK
jgi:WD40 repeat protein